MNKCQTPCIYYRENFDKTKKPMVKIVCDYRDQEIKNLSEEQIKLCEHYKTYKDVKKNYTLTKV